MLRIWNVMFLLLTTPVWFARDMSLKSSFLLCAISHQASFMFVKYKAERVCRKLFLGLDILKIAKVRKNTKSGAMSLKSKDYVLSLTFQFWSFFRDKLWWPRVIILNGPCIRIPDRTLIGDITIRQEIFYFLNIQNHSDMKIYIHGKPLQPASAACTAFVLSQCSISN